MKLIEYFSNVSEQASSARLSARELPNSVDLLGTAEVAERLYPILCELGIKVGAVYDNSPHKRGIKFFEHTVRSLNEKEDSNSLVICAYNSSVIKENLSNSFDILLWSELLANISLVKYLPWNCFSLNEKHLFSNIEKYQNIYDRCIDEVSKRELLLQIKSRFFSIQITEPYNVFGPEFCSENYSFLSDNSVILDGGAFDGDTATRFLNFVNKTFKIAPHVICVESDLLSLNRLIEKLGSNENVTIINAFLGDNLSLTPINYSGSVRSTYSYNTYQHLPRSVVATTTIDQLYKLLRFNYVKLDIEGAEALALSGAFETIKSRKCVFALSIYHKVEDILTLSNFFGKGYEFAFTAHAQRPWDSVMYAIPKL